MRFSLCVEALVLLAVLLQTQTQITLTCAKRLSSESGTTLAHQQEHRQAQNHTHAAKKQVSQSSSSHSKKKSNSSALPGTTSKIVDMDGHLGKLRGRGIFSDSERGGSSSSDSDSDSNSDIDDDGLSSSHSGDSEGASSGLFGFLDDLSGSDSVSDTDGDMSEMSELDETSHGSESGHGQDWEVDDDMESLDGSIPDFDKLPSIKRLRSSLSLQHRGGFGGMGDILPRSGGARVFRDSDSSDSSDSDSGIDQSDDEMDSSLDSREHGVQKPVTSSASSHVYTCNDFKHKALVDHSDIFYVLSDVDDTIISSGGSIAGVDTSLPKKELYPGVTSLFYQVSSTNTAASAPLFRSSRQPSSSVLPAPMSILSARPDTILTRLGSSDPLIKAMAAMGAEMKQPSFKVEKVYYGLTSDAVMAGLAMRTPAFKRFASRKYESYLTTLAQPYYDGKCGLFFGDDGQGDLLVATHALKNKEPRFAGAFIHSVHPQCTKESGCFAFNTKMHAAGAGKGGHGGHGGHDLREAGIPKGGAKLQSRHATESKGGEFIRPMPPKELPQKDRKAAGVSSYFGDYVPSAVSSVVSSLSSVFSSPSPPSASSKQTEMTSVHVDPTIAFLALGANITQSKNELGHARKTNQSASAKTTVTSQMEITQHAKQNATHAKQNATHAHAKKSGLTSRHNATVTTAHEQHQSHTQHGPKVKASAYIPVPAHYPISFFNNYLDAAKIAYDKNMLTLSGLRSSILHFIAHKNFAPCLEDESFCPGCRDFLRAFHACYEWLDRNRHLDGSRVHKDATAQEKKEIHDFVSYVRAAADSTLRDVDLLSSEHGGEHGGRDDQMVYSKGVRDVWLIDTKMDAQKAIVEALEHVVCVVQDDVSKGYTLRTAGLKSSLKGVLSETQACERAFGLGAQSVM